MLASELIAHLQARIQEHGDLEVIVGRGGHMDVWAEDVEAPKPVASDCPQFWSDGGVAAKYLAI